MITSGLGTCLVRAEPGAEGDCVTQDEELGAVLIPLPSAASGEERAARPLAVQPGPAEQHPGAAGPAQLPAHGSA